MKNHSERSWSTKIYCIYSQLFGKLKHHSETIESNSMNQPEAQALPGEVASKHYLVHISELELAINYWRQLWPSPRDTMTLCKEASLLAEYYATMIIEGQQSISTERFSPVALSAYEEVYTTLKARPGLQQAA